MACSGGCLRRRIWDNDFHIGWHGNTMKMQHSLAAFLNCMLGFPSLISYPQKALLIITLISLKSQLNFQIANVVRTHRVSLIPICI